MASCLPIYLTYHTKTSVDYGFVKLFKRDAIGFELHSGLCRIKRGIDFNNTGLIHE